ncbi:hypothetical protein RJ640_019405 [Escallonia rubra]|uniref:Retrotransposon gag domain-containing protein n=1 Tax=Escallonia rubra TaxID=112253 RepID=A0AA88QN28_9ASTE|nr:hypothetical protein RJ640_019405 [Escallonia rubra]
MEAEVQQRTRFTIMQTVVGESFFFASSWEHIYIISSYHLVITTQNNKNKPTLQSGQYILIHQNPSFEAETESTWHVGVHGEYNLVVYRNKQPTPDRPSLAFQSKRPDRPGSLINVATWQRDKNIGMSATLFRAVDFLCETLQGNFTETPLNLPFDQLYLMWREVAQDLWTDIKERFSVVNGPRIQQLKTELADCKQKGLTIVNYYGKLKILWDELANFE